MPKDPRMLTHQQATTFYNHLGAKQDWQAFFEALATRELIAHASFETAQAVFEFGCGTGAFAELVLSHHLPPQARYLAVDSSATMVRLTQPVQARPFRCARGGASNGWLSPVRRAFWFV